MGILFIMRQYKHFAEVVIVFNIGSYSHNESYCTNVLRLRQYYAIYNTHSFRVLFMSNIVF